MDKNNKATIKLNGRSYNALSGQQIGSSPLQVGNIDGIVRRSAQNSYSAPTKTAPIKPVRTKARTSIQAPPKRPAKTNTLMRTAVKKPVKPTRLVSKANTPLSLAKSDAILTTPMVGVVDTKLARRAQSIKLSGKISRFGGQLRSATNSETKPLEAIKPQQAAPRKPDMFEVAIEKATSHEQPPLTKKELRAIHGRNPIRKRLALYSVGAVLALAVGGYAIYSNMPNVMVKVAAMRAGFSASLPAYSPSGFSLSSVNYSPGVVSFNFASSPSKGYVLIEHSSDWDSATLASSVVIPTQGSSYKKEVVGGQTIYMYGKDEAAWVSNGIWYQVDGKGNLSQTQLINMATNL